LAWAHVAIARETIVALPTVHVKAQAIRFHGRQALLVESIIIGNLRGVKLRVTCDRCRRYTAKIRETRPTSLSRKFSQVDWIIMPGRDIEIDVSRRGLMGRFLLLGASGGNALVFKSVGCLSASTRHASCPHKIKQPKSGSGVSGGAPPGSSGSPIVKASPPVTKITSNPLPVQTTLPVTFAYSSSTANATFQCSLDKAPWSSCAATGVSYASVAEAHHTFSVRASDTKGMTDPMPPVFEWIQDVPPSTTIFEGPAGTVTTGNVGFSFVSSKPNSTFQCELDGGAWTTCPGGTQGYTNLGEGSHTFAVRAVDSLGVADPNPASRTWSQVNRYGITSYNRMQPSAPYHGQFEYAYQAFTAQSNTITLLGVTVGHVGLPAGVPVGYSVLVKLCTNQPGAGGSCNTIGQVSPQVVNYGNSQGDIGDVAVSPGATYWIVYYPPQPYGNGWVTYWWAGGSSISSSDQMQAIVQGYNR
jgi:hypothetical protein